MRRWGLILVVMSLALAGIALPAAAVGEPETVLVYTGGGGLSEGYTNFGSATGKAIVTSTSLAGLAQYDCVVLPINTSFSPEDLSSLTSYVNEGGRLLALGEHSGFEGAIAAMNAVATELQSDLSLVAAFIDPIVEGTYPSTSNIDLSPFTVGVSSIQYAATSQVVVAEGSTTAHSLVRTQGEGETATTFIGVEQIGLGVFLLSGDSNVFSDNNSDPNFTGYTDHDNGPLAANICDGATFEPNEAPVAQDDVAETEPGESVNIAVLANDTDADGDQLFVTNLSDPDNGSAFVDEDGTVSYTPDEGFSGDIDTFTYTASDGISESDPATVTVGVFEGDVFFADVPADQSFVLETQSGPPTAGNPERFALNFAPGPGGPAFIVEIPEASVAACTVPGVLPKPCIGNNQAQYYISSNATLFLEWHRSLFVGIKAGQVDFYKQNPDGEVLAPLPPCNKVGKLPPCEQKVHTLANGTIQGIVLAGPSSDDPIKGGYG